MCVCECLRVNKFCCPLLIFCFDVSPPTTVAVVCLYGRNVMCDTVSASGSVLSTSLSRFYLLAAIRVAACGVEDGSYPLAALLTL